MGTKVKPERLVKLGCLPVSHVPNPRPSSGADNPREAAVLDILHSERFQDKAPHYAYAMLLDDGHYHCSIRIMYRMLAAEHGDVKDRRRMVIPIRKPSSKP